MNMRLVRFTKWLLDVMFFVGIGITVGIPEFSSWWETISRRLGSII